MATIALIGLAVVHLIFLFKVWTELGFLWCLACFFIPFVGLFLVYREWPTFRGIFFTELVLIAVVIFSRSGTT